MYTLQAGGVVLLVITPVIEGSWHELGHWPERELVSFVFLNTHTGGNLNAQISFGTSFGFQNLPTKKLVLQKNRNDRFAHGDTFLQHRRHAHFQFPKERPESTEFVKIEKTNSNSTRDFSKRINFTRVDPFVWSTLVVKIKKTQESTPSVLVMPKKNNRDKENIILPLFTTGRFGPLVGSTTTTSTARVNRII